MTRNEYQNAIKAVLSRVAGLPKDQQIISLAKQVVEAHHAVSAGYARRDPPGTTLHIKIPPRAIDVDTTVSPNS